MTTRSTLLVGDVVCLDMRRKDGSVRKATKRTKGPVVGVVKVVRDGGDVIITDGRGQFLVPVSTVRR